MLCGIVKVCALDGNLEECLNEDIGQRNLNIHKRVAGRLTLALKIT
jgi:hypothetical protein